MVRLEYPSILSQISRAKKFQFLNGAIRILNGAISYENDTIVSIPKWCD